MRFWIHLDNWLESIRNKGIFFQSTGKLFVFLVSSLVICKGKKLIDWIHMILLRCELWQWKESMALLTEKQTKLFCQRVFPTTPIHQCYLECHNSLVRHTNLLYLKASFWSKSIIVAWEKSDWRFFNASVIASAIWTSQSKHQLENSLLSQDMQALPLLYQDQGSPHYSM